MASTTQDKRVVRVAVTRAELVNFLGSQAKAAGIIDFDPDRTEVFDQGTTGFEIVFEKDTV
jgi:hypothetical protein